MGVNAIAAQPQSLDGTVSARKDSPEKIKQAAEQFEALLIGQMMKSMRESSTGGWMGESSDSSSLSMLELADEQFARALSARGGLGIARMVMQGLAPSSSPEASASPEVSVKGSSSE